MVKMEEKNMPRRGENIYKRKDGRWEARYIYSFKEDGSPRYRSIYAADYLTVKKKQNDAKRKMDPRLFQSVRMKKNISFYGLLWLERLKPSSKESTYVRYHYLFSHYISPMIGDRLVYTFSNKDCEIFLNRLLVSGKSDGSGLAPKTVTDIRSVVKLILKTAENTTLYLISYLDSISSVYQQQPNMITLVITYFHQSMYMAHISESSV